MDVRAVPGTRIANPTTREIVYAPPEGADIIREKLSAWERFIHAEDDLDPLVRMAVAHYQFEAIHPFHDGNGRTGRVINILMLIEAGLLDDPILYMLDVVRESASSTTRKISSIRACQEDIADRARAATPGGRDAQFLNVLFEQPYCRINTVVERCAVSRQTASSWLHALVAPDLLSDVKVGRELLFVNHELLEVLTRAE